MRPYFEDDESPMWDAPEREIVGLSIPDDDFVGWHRALKRGKFTDEEIDLILRRLNKKYESERSG